MFYSIYRNWFDSFFSINIAEGEYWDSSSTVMKKLYGLAKATILGDHSSLAGENKKLILS
jgi:hypothetical protein